MIEKVILDYLNGTLSVPVHMEAPENKPEKYVILEKTGSGNDDFIENATFAIKSHAATLEEAAELNEAVKSAMDNIIVLNQISKCKLNSDYNFTDTSKKGYRYQAVYDVFY